MSGTLLHPAVFSGTALILYNLFASTLWITLSELTDIMKNTGTAINRAHHYIMKDIFHIIFGLNEKSQLKVTPSRFIQEMEMDTEERMKKLSQFGCKTSLIKDPCLFLKTFQFSSNMVVFQKFSPGETYQIQLTVRNICKELKALNIAYESSSVLTVSYTSKVITKIAPGMLISFTIQFIPEEKQDYTHAITFYTDNGSFTLPVIAIGPRPLLDIPDQVHLASSPVKIKTSKTFIVRNIGEIPAVFNFLIERPFSIEPLKGILKPEEVMHVTISFINNKVGEFEGILKVQYDAGEEVFSSLYASTENLNVRLEKGILRVDDTYIGLSRQRIISLFNRSSYSLEYKWKKFATSEQEDSAKNKLKDAYKSVQELETLKHMDIEYYKITDYETHCSAYERIFEDEVRDLEKEEFNFNHPVFSICPLEGELWPGSSMEFTVIFKPEDAIDYSIEAYCDIKGREKRIPLKLQGKGKGPFIQLNVDHLNIDKLFLHSSHIFEIVALNKGDIPGGISFQPKEAPFGGEIFCDPESYYLQPEECRSFILTYSSSKHGDFLIDLIFQIQESGEILKTLLTGSVISPLLHFGKNYLNFGDVGIGYTYVHHVALNNLSAVPVEYRLKVTDDGNEPAITGKEFVAQDEMILLPTNPKEFTIKPCSGIVAPYSSEEIEVILVANRVRECNTAIILEMWDSGSEIVKLPIQYNAKCPDIFCLPDKIVIHYCFIEYPYSRTIALQNSSKLSTWFRIMSQKVSSETKATYSVSVTKGSLKGNSKVEIPIKITTHEIGQQNLEIQMLVMGAPSPILCVTIVCNGQGPVITTMPEELDWGPTVLLEECSENLTVMNDSPIPAKYHATLKGNDSPWSASPDCGTILAYESLKFKVTLYLVEPGPSTDILQIQTENGSTICINLKAFGVGSSVAFEPNIFPTFNLGILFSQVLTQKQMKVINRGRKKIAICWSQTPDMKMFQNKNFHEEDLSMTIFSFVPPKLELGPKEEKTIILQALCSSAKTITENFYCNFLGEQKRGKATVVNCEVTANFIEPLLKFSVPEIVFYIDIPAGDAFPMCEERIDIENVSLLPLYLELSISYPFTMKFEEDNVLSKEVQLDIQHSTSIVVCFDSAYKTDRYCKHLRTSICIHFKDHPLEYLLPVRADVNFPNIKIEPSEKDFDCKTVSNHGCQILFCNISALPVKYFLQWIESSVQFNSDVPDVKLQSIDVQYCSENNDPFLMNSNDPYVLSNKESCNKVPKEKSTLLASTNEISNISYDSIKERNSHLIPSEEWQSKKSNVISSEINTESNHGKEKHNSDSPEMILSKESLTKMSAESQQSKAINSELYHTVKKKLLPLITKYHNRYNEITSLKCLSNTFEKPDLITQVFEITPNFGDIFPFAKHYGYIGLTSDYSHTSAEGTCQCIVEGGPIEEIHMKAKASCLKWYIDKNFINFGYQVYIKALQNTFTIYNTGPSGFEFIINVITPEYGNLIAQTNSILEVHPQKGYINGNSKVEIMVTYQPGSLGEFQEELQVEVEYFNCVPVYLKGYAAFPQVLFNLPRLYPPSIPNEIGYAAIGTITSHELFGSSINRIAPESIAQITAAQTEIFKEDDWVLITQEELCPTVADVDLAIERIIAKNHINNNPFVFLPKTLNTKVKAVPNLIVAPYLIDFGLVTTETVRCYKVSLVNVGPNSINVSLLKDHYKEKGVVANFKEIRHLSIGATTQISFVFSPLRSIYPEKIQEMECCFYFEVHAGARIPVEIHALVTVPYITVSTKILNFGQVKCGECKAMSVVLKNEGLLSCHWNACVTYSAQAASYNKRNDNNTGEFFINYTEDMFIPERVAFLDIFFQPQKAGYCEQMLLITVEQNPDTEKIVLQGTGLEPYLLISEPVIDFGPMLPHPEQAEKYFTIENPCSYPIEFFFPNYDRVIPEEERILRVLTHYYKVEELYIPVRKVGDKLPETFYNFYHELAEKVKEKVKSETCLKHPGSEYEKLETETSLTSSFPSNHSTILVEDSLIEDADKLEHFIHGYIDEQHKRKNFCYEENNLLKATLTAAIETIPCESNISATGTLLIFYGAPKTDYCYTAHKLGRILNVPVLNVDDIIIVSAALASTIASAKIKNLIYSALGDHLLQNFPEKLEQFQLEIDKEMKMPENEDLTAKDLQKAKENGECKDAVEKLQEAIKILTTDSENSLVKSAKMQTEKGSNKESEKEDKQVLSKNGTSASTPRKLQLPEHMLTDILKQRLDMLDYVVIDGLNSKLFGNAMSTLNALLEAVGNNKFVILIALHSTYSQYKDWLIAKKEVQDREAESQYAAKLTLLENLDDDDLELLSEEDFILLQNIRLKRKHALKEKNEAMKQKQIITRDNKLKKTKSEEQHKRHKQKEKPKASKDKIPESLKSNESKQNAQSSKEKNPSREIKGNKSKTDKGSKSNKSSGDEKQKSRTQLRDNDFGIKNEAELISQFKKFETDFLQILNLSETFNTASVSHMSHRSQTRKFHRRPNSSELIKTKSPSEVKSIVMSEEKEIKCMLYEFSLWIINNKNPEQPIIQGVFKKLMEMKQLQWLKRPQLNLASLAEKRMTVYSAVKKPLPRTKILDSGVFTFSFVEKIEQKMTGLEHEDKSIAPSCADNVEDNVMALQHIPPSCTKGNTMEEVLSISEMAQFTVRSLTNKQNMSSSSTSSTMKETRKNKRVSTASSVTKKKSARKSSRKVSSANNMNGRIEENVLKYHWLLAPGERLLWKMKCNPLEQGLYVQEYIMEIATWKTQYTIKGKAFSCLPSFLTAPEAIFPKVAATKLNDRAYFTTYFLDSETFDFGGILINPKTKQSSRLRTKLRFSSNSQLDTEIHFMIINQKPSKAFTLEIYDLTVKHNEAEYVNVEAHPNTVGEFSALLVCEVKNNPSVYTVKLSCMGVKPDIQISPKVISFDQTLLHRKETCTVYLTSKCLAPLTWKFPNVHIFEEDFEFSTSTGTLNYEEPIEIKVTYAASKVGVFAKQPLKLEVYGEKGSDEALLSDTININADTCDIMNDVQMDSENVDFGKAKVGVEYQKNINLKNVGRHDYFYRIAYEPKSDTHIPYDIEKVIHIEPTDGKISHSGLPCVLKVKLKAFKELELANTQLFKCHILDVRNKDNSIAYIPISFTVATHYSRYAITPTQTIDFGALTIGTKQKQNLFIKNIGLFPFKYSIIVNRPESNILNIYKMEGKSDASSAESSRSKRKDSSKSTSKRSGSSQSASRKHKRKKERSDLRVGPFTVYKPEGEVLSSSSVLVPVECTAAGEGDYNEEIFICIYNSEKDAESIRLLGKGCQPGIDFGDIQSIFQEHQICQTTNDFKFLAKGVSYCLYVHAVNTFKFCNTSICKEAKATLRFHNKGLTPCILQASVTEAGYEEDGIFGISPAIINIEQCSTGLITITFSPKAIQIYTATLQIILEPNLNTFSFKLSGEGTVPQIKLIVPKQISHNDKPKILFNPTLLGHTSSKQLEFKNSGDILCKVIVELYSNLEGLFTLCPTKETTPFLKLGCTNDPIQYTTIVNLKPSDSVSFDVDFTPHELGHFKGEIKLSITENPFENTTVLLTAEAYMQDITLDKVDFAEDNTYKQNETENKKPTSYQLDFDSCYATQTYNKHFLICNNSNYFYYFEWIPSKEITFTPNLGHILPKSSKDITVTLMSAEATHLNQVGFSCKIAKIKLIGNEMTNSNVFGSMNTVAKLSTSTGKELEIESNSFLWNQNEAVVSRSTIMEEEPKYQLMENNMGKIVVYISALVAYPKYECNITEIKFKDTLMFQNCIYKFTLKNSGVVPIHYHWQICMEETSISLPEVTSIQQPSVSSLIERPFCRAPNEARPLSGKEIFLEMYSETTVVQKSESLKKRSKLYFLRKMPFKIEPEFGILTPNEALECVITFCPTEVFEYSGKLICKVEMDHSENPIQIQVSGRSLMPYCHFDVEESDYLTRRQRNASLTELLAFQNNLPLYSNPRVIEFNVLGTGVESVKKFFAINPTEKTYSYIWRNIKLFHHTLNATFNCMTQEGYIEYGKRTEMTFSFLADEIGTYESFWNFIIPEYDIEVPFLLVGNVSEPCIFFLKTHIDLPPTLKGIRSSADIILTNNESISLSYKFKLKSLYSEGQLEQLCVEPLAHTIEAQSDQLIRLEFVPSMPGNYEFHPECYIQRLQHPLILHVTGLCYAVQPLINYTDKNGMKQEVLEGVVQNIDFGTLIPKHSYSINVTLTNIGKTAFNFLWMYNEVALQGKNFHLHILPKEGYIASQCTKNCTVQIKAMKKSELHNFEIILQISQGPKYKILIHGVATTPQYEFSFLEHDFGYCFIQKSDRCFYSTCLQFINKEEDAVTLECHFENKPHMTIEYNDYLIPAKKTISIRICFLPQEIRKYEEILPFMINGVSEKRIKIFGEGTMVQMQLIKQENRCIDLGALKINKKVCKTISVCNKSKCLAVVHFRWLEEVQTPRDQNKNLLQEEALSSSVHDQFSEVLKIQPSDPVQILPQKAINVSFTFTPIRRMNPFVKRVMMQINDHIEPLCSLRGSCLDAEFALDRTQIHFGALVQGCKSTVRIMLMNKGDIGSRFVWKASELNNFSINPMTGYSSPCSVITTNVTFHPSATMECTESMVYCDIEHYKLLTLTLLGSCIDLPSPKEVINFQVPVRQTCEKEIKIQNNSSGSWQLHPEMSGEFFSGSSIINIPSQTTGQYIVTYTPLRMTSSDMHTGSLIFRLPDAHVLLYTLMGTAELPEPNDRLMRIIPCKTPYTELLNVINWLSTSQRFHRSIDLIKEDKVDPIYTATGNEYIEVPPFGEREYRLKFYAYKEAVITLKVTFKNENDGEYQFYEITLQIVKCGPLDFIRLSTYVRTPVHIEILIQNPLETNVHFQVSCSCTDLHFPTNLVALPKSTKSICIEYLPLIPGEKTLQFEVISSELGVYPYEINLKALHALDEKNIQFLTYLGLKCTKSVDFTNMSSTKSEFKCEVNNQNFIIEKSASVISVPPKSKGYIEVTYEPNDIGDTYATLNIKSSTTGEFIFPLNGTCKMPIPQGPFTCKSGKKCIILFKNVFLEQKTFAIDVDISEIFIIMNDKMRTIMPKMETIIELKMKNDEELQDLEKRFPVTGRLVITCTDPALCHIQWVYYLKGLLN